MTENLLYVLAFWEEGREKILLSYSSHPVSNIYTHFIISHPVALDTFDFAFKESKTKKEEKLMFEEIKHNEGQDKRKILQEGSKKDNFNQRKRDTKKPWIIFWSISISYIKSYNI